MPCGGLCADGLKLVVDGRAGGFVEVGGVAGGTKLVFDSGLKHVVEGFFDGFPGIGFLDQSVVAGVEGSFDVESNPVECWEDVDEGFGKHAGGMEPDQVPHVSNFRDG